MFGKDAQAREVMTHLKRDIADYLRFHLLAVAAGQAVEVMRGMSAWLGDPQSTDENGQPVWSGIAGEFQEGRRCVQAMLGAVDQRIGQLRADAQQEHATYIKLASDVLPEPVKLTGDISAWSEEVLLEFGGSSRLFPQLGDDRLRASLLLKLFRRAQTQLTVEQIGGAEPPDPLLERLSAMSPQERQRIFNEWIKSAMPWINARFSAEFTPRADQFKCFIGVGDANAWRRMEAEIRAAVPTGSFHGDLVSIVNTGIAGKAVCYIELSGFPMTVLRGLPTWRTSYQIENPKIPTHLHFDSTRFRHPISPSMDELNRLADDYEWFLQANALGVIKRKPDLADREASFQPRGQYLFEVEPGSGEWLQIGNEFAIRSNGLPAYYRDQVIAAVQQKLAAMGPNQLALLAALMRHYQHRVYEPKLEVDETGAQLPSPSLPNITAHRLYDQWLKRARAMNPALSPAQIDAATGKLMQWTELVPDSASDAYHWEVERAVDKRVIRAGLLASDERAAQALDGRRPAAAPAAAALQAVLRRRPARTVSGRRDRAAHRARRRHARSPGSGTCNGIRRWTSGSTPATWRSWRRCSTTRSRTPTMTYPIRSEAPAVADEVIYRCVNGACVRPFPRRVNYCPFCGISQSTGLPRPGRCWSDRRRSRSSSRRRSVAGAGAGGRAGCRRLRRRHHRRRLFRRAPSALPRRARPPEREPVRLRYWLLALGVLALIWITQRPTTERIDARIDKAMALATACKSGEAQAELIALKDTRATPEQLQRLQAALNEADAACDRKRARGKARSKAARPRASQQAQSARNLVADARQAMARGDYKAASDKMEVCVAMVDAGNRDCIALKASADRLQGEMRRCLAAGREWVGERCQ